MDESLINSSNTDITANNVQETTRRRSVFESTNDICTEEKINSYMDGWNKRWCKYTMSNASCVTYPKDYLEKIINEKESWTMGINKILEKDEKFECKSENIVLTEPKLSEEQEQTLKEIDYNYISRLREKEEKMSQMVKISENILKMMLDDTEKEIEKEQTVISCLLRKS